jgi:hypothetical protein
MVLSDKPQSILVITNTSMKLHSKNYMASTGYHITLLYYDDWCYRQHSMQSQDISICVNMTHKHMNLSLYMYYLTLGRGYRAHITDVRCKSWKYVVYREASIQRRKQEKMRVKTPVEHILQISFRYPPTKLGHHLNVTWLQATSTTTPIVNQNLQKSQYANHSLPNCDFQSPPL